MTTHKSSFLLGGLVALSLFLMSIIILFTNSSSVSFSFLSFLIFGILVSKLLSAGKIEDFHNLLRIFFFAFFVYVLYALMAYLSYLQNNGFLAPDHQYFYESGHALGNRHTLYEIYKACFIDNIHKESEGAHFIFGVLAFMANKYFDGNSFFFQTLHVTFFAVLINLFVYKILLFYTNEKKAFFYTLLYLLFAYILVRAPWLGRDNHITLLYAIGIYIIHLNFTTIRLITLIFVQFLIAQLRFEHAVAFTFLPLVYIYFGTKNSKIKVLYYTVAAIPLLAILTRYSSFIYNAFLTVNETVVRYDVHSTSAAEESSGLGSYIQKLPAGLQQITKLLFSQTLPFPPWININRQNSTLVNITGLIQGAAPIFWGYVFFSSVINVFRYFKTIPRLTVALFFFAIIFLLGNSVNLSVRRLISVYPIIFSVFVYFQVRQSPFEKNRLLRNYIAIYSSLLLSYFFIKYF